jgi:DNA-binding NtrC family response regulator
VTLPDEISHTVPSRPSSRGVERFGTLAMVGNPASLDALGSGRLLTLFGAGAEIGRRPPPGRMRTVVTLGDRSVSSYHAQITQENEGFVIEDKASTNGTLVDGQRILKPTLLREGSVLFLGSQVMVFRTMTGAEISAIESDIADPFAPVATLSPALAILCAKLRLLAPSPSELFLLGETGVGKEVFANAIHVTSGRKGRLMAINCAALPRELVESELFGYERGAHSTAKERKAGLIETAEGGTLFLDELAEMPIDVQSKLLRFLQDRKYMAIGSTRLETANVRIIAASSRVARASGAPAIQDALLGRLGAQPVQLPPLRDRLEDLGRLVSYFLGAVDCDRPLDAEAFQALFLYNWPHNVRELEKVITEAELLSRGMTSIGVDHLPSLIVDTLDFASQRSPTGPGPTARAASDPPRQRRPVPSAPELRLLMRQFHGNVAHVSQHLGRQWAVISRTLRRYGIDPAEFRPVGVNEGDGAGFMGGSADGGAPGPSHTNADDEEEGGDEGDTLA